MVRPVSLTGFTVFPPDGTATPISGTGPATPSSTILDLSLTGDELDGPLALATSEADTSSVLRTSAVGPVLVPAGDSTLRDTTNGFGFGFGLGLTLDAGRWTLDAGRWTLARSWPSPRSRSRIRAAPRPPRRAPASSSPAP